LHYQNNKKGGEKESVNSTTINHWNSNAGGRHTPVEEVLQKGTQLIWG
jgi:hypothetical protein